MEEANDGRWPKPGLLAEAGVIMIKEKECLHCTVE